MTCICNKDGNKQSLLMLQQTTSCEDTGVDAPTPSSYRVVHKIKISHTEPSI